MSSTFSLDHAQDFSAQSTAAPLAFLYEHPQWFAPVFAELERRGTPFQKLFAPDHFYAVDTTDRPSFRVLFNRMSPSADRRDHGSNIFHTLSWLRHLELQGVRVVNGSKAFQFEISKALQHSLLQSLGLRYIPSQIGRAHV